MKTNWPLIKKHLKNFISETQKQAKESKNISAYFCLLRDLIFADFPISILINRCEDAAQIFTLNEMHVDWNVFALVWTHRYIVLPASAEKYLGRTRSVINKKIIN